MTLQQVYDAMGDPNETGCRLWLGYINVHGYGQLWFNGKKTRAHTVTYELFVGPLQPGLELDHLCRTHACVEPSHLEAVTHHENVLRGNVGKHNKIKTHCLRGHELTGDNLIPAHLLTGRRACRACGKAAALASYHRRKPNSPKNRYGPLGAEGAI